ncbi:MAG: NAD(P)H-dependent oxidoreductase [Candidatus Anstonellales archaeon]
MKITIISASTRKNSQSRRVSDYLSSRLAKLSVDNTILDLNEKRLPLYGDTEDGPWTKLWGEISNLLAQSDGFVFVSPEWDGMFSVGLHNFFHYVDKEMADKPVLTVGVSSGRGGRYPLQQMRIMGYKNKRFVVIPESLYYEQVEKILVDGALTDNQTTERTDYALKVLVEYAKALNAVRQSGVIDYEKFPNGL